MSRPGSIRPLALAIGLALASSASHAGTTVTVTSGLDTAAGCSLREAIALIKNPASQNGCVGVGDANSHDTIDFDASSVPANTTITLSVGRIDVVSLTAPLTIEGGGRAIDAAHQSQVLYLFGSTVTLNGLTLLNGYTTNYAGGGALEALGGTVTLDHCTVSGSMSPINVGGGIYATGTLILVDTTVTGNSANLGGGLDQSGGTLTLTNSHLTGNTGSNTGGGLRATNAASVTLMATDVSGNSSSTGGGLYSGNASIYAIDSTLSGNTGGLGGGAVHASGGALRVLNSTITGNSAAEGGGLYLTENNATVLDSTISGNTASSAVKGGGGIAVSGMTVLAHLTLRNTILSGNTSSGAPDLLILGVPVLARYDLLGTDLNTSPYSDAGAHNVFNDDPGLYAAAPNGGPTQTMALKPGSPAVGVGNLAYASALNYDQRGFGFPRTLDGSIDIGAFQHQRDDQIFIDGLEPLP